MGNALLRFKNQPYFLVWYLSLHLAIFSMIVAAQAHYLDWNSFWGAPFSWRGLWLLPLGLIIGIKIPVLMHNCVHGNLKPKWLNAVGGELAGIYITLAMEAFALNHMMHHANNDTDLDPHNPKGRHFLPFFFANNFGGSEPVRTKYMEFHGDTPKNQRLFTFILFLHFLNVPLRFTFWFLLLGPSLFVTFFVPSYLFHMFVFSHINYVTHETLENGRVEIYNLDSNLYYRLVNYFGSGVYYHRNHHLNPTFFNPQQGRSASRWMR